MGSAGVLVYMSNGTQTRYVLGREQFAHDWKGSMKWSDFGGRPQKDETPIKTAAREFFEETLGVFGDILPMLEKRQYDFRLVLRRLTHRGMIYKYLYVLRLPWDANISQRYHGRREHLKSILFAIAKARLLQRQLYVRRFPVPDNLYRVNHQLVLITELLAIEQLSNNTSRIKVMACIPEHKKYMGKLQAPIQMYLDVPNESAETYAHLIQTKNRLERLIVSFPDNVASKAILYQKVGSFSAYLPFVQRDFLEKDQIRLWELSELVRALRHRQHLRVNFGPPLKLALRELGLLPNPTSSQHNKT